MREDAADLPVLAFGETKLNPAIASGAPLEIGVDRAVVNAFDRDPFRELLELGLAHLAVGAGAIGADDAAAGELECALELAVVGEEEQAFGHEVEPANRHQARKTGR